MADDRTSTLKTTVTPSADTQKSTEARTSDTQASAPWFAAINPGMAVWAKSSVALLNGMSDMAEMANQFSQTRLRANIDACKALSSCRDPETLVGLQQDYVENAMAQYREHTKTIAEQAGTMISAAKPPAADS